MFLLLFNIVMGWNVAGWYNLQQISVGGFNTDNNDKIIIMEKMKLQQVQRKM